MDSKKSMPSIPSGESNKNPSDSGASLSRPIGFGKDLLISVMDWAASGANAAT